MRRGTLIVAFIALGVVTCISCRSTRTFRRPRIRILNFAAFPKLREYARRWTGRNFNTVQNKGFALSKSVPTKRKYVYSPAAIPHLPPPEIKPLKKQELLEKTKMMTAKLRHKGKLVSERTKGHSYLVKEKSVKQIAEDAKKMYLKRIQVTKVKSAKNIAEDIRRRYKQQKPLVVKISNPNALSRLKVGYHSKNNERTKLRAPPKTPAKHHLPNHQVGPAIGGSLRGSLGIDKWFVRKNRRERMYNDVRHTVRKSPFTFGENSHRIKRIRIRSVNPVDRSSPHYLYRQKRLQSILNFIINPSSRIGGGNSSTKNSNVTTQSAASTDKDTIARQSASPFRTHDPSKSQMQELNRTGLQVAQGKNIPRASKIKDPLTQIEYVQESVAKQVSPSYHTPGPIAIATTSQIPIIHEPAQKLHALYVLPDFANQPTELIMEGNQGNRRNGIVSTQLPTYQSSQATTKNPSHIATNEPASTPQIVSTMGTEIPPPKGDVVQKREGTDLPVTQIGTSSSQKVPQTLEINEYLRMARVLLNRANQQQQQQKQQQQYQQNQPKVNTNNLPSYTGSRELELGTGSPTRGYQLQVSSSQRGIYLNPQDKSARPQVKTEQVPKPIVGIQNPVSSRETQQLSNISSHYPHSRTLDTVAGIRPEQDQRGRYRSSPAYNKPRQHMTINNQKTPRGQTKPPSSYRNRQQISNIGHRTLKYQTQTSRRTGVQSTSTFVPHINKPQRTYSRNSLNPSLIPEHQQTQGSTRRYRQEQQRNATLESFGNAQQRSHQDYENTPSINYNVSPKSTPPLNQNSPRGIHLNRPRLNPTPTISTAANSRQRMNKTPITTISTSQPLVSSGVRTPRPGINKPPFASVSKTQGSIHSIGSAKQAQASASVRQRPYIQQRQRAQLQRPVDTMLDFV